MSSVRLQFVEVFVVLLGFFFGAIECDRILAVVPTPSFSHQVVFRPLWRELANRGHEVVLITTDPDKDPELNITQIDLNYVYHLWNVEWNFIKHYEDNKNNPYKLANIVRDLLLKLYETELNHPEVKALIQNENEHFDLAMVEVLHPLMFSFAKRFNCPSVGISSMELISFIHEYVGNPIHPVAYPDVFLPFEPGKMTFWQRVGSVLFYLFAHINVYLSGEVKEAALVQKHFGEGYPTMTEMISNVSMLFINSHPALVNRPLGPNMINIGGGFHLKPPKPLPQDIQILLDESDQGAIYFSLGTNVLSTSITDEKLKVFLEVFEELPQYKFLWKFDVEVPNLPSNVILSKWFPQQDVLAHPNVKAFITQGGLQSMEEAIFSHVPMVIIPFLYDQSANAHRCVRNGLGIMIERHTLTKDAVKSALIKVINETSYEKKIKEFSILLQDQPMHGLDQAVWWTEYLLRHKGAKHLKSKMIDLPFYQVYLLDVGAFLCITPIAIIYLFSIVVNKRLFQ